MILLGFLLWSDSRLRLYAIARRCYSWKRCFHRVVSAERYPEFWYVRLRVSEIARERPPSVSRLRTLQVKQLDSSQTPRMPAPLPGTPVIAPMGPPPLIAPGSFVAPGSVPVPRAARGQS